MLCLKDNSESEIEIIGPDDARKKFSRITGITGGLKNIKSKNAEISEDEIKKICQFFGYILYLDKIENQKDKDNQEAQLHEISHNSNKEKKTEIQIDNEQQNTQVTQIQNLPTISQDAIDNNSHKCLYFIKTCKLIGRCFFKFYSE